MFKTIIVFNIGFTVGLLVGFHDAGAASTPAECAKWAEGQPGYGGDATKNVLRRDSLVRACLAGERA